MGSMTSSNTLRNGHRVFRAPTFKMIQLYLLLMLVFSIVYLFSIYNFMTSSPPRLASFRYVEGLLYIIDKVEDEDIQHPAVASLSDPPDEVAPHPPLTEPRDFFRRFKQPSAHCRKLVNIGGQGCLRRYEGNKDVCLDPEVIPRRGSCLAYSFGVADDITFEDSLDNLRNCTVHLYDPTVLQHGWFLEPPSPKRVFHSEALATHHMDGPSAVSVHTVMEPLDALLERNGHRHATLDYLKLDIEGGEWEVLRHLVENGLLDNVVQLALELHSTDLRDKPRDRWLGVLQERDNVLHSLEEAGFRRVRVVDNEHYLCRVDFRGPQDRPEEGAKSAGGKSSDGVATLRSGNDLAQGNYSTQIQKRGHELNSAAGTWSNESETNQFEIEEPGREIRDGQNHEARGSSTNSLSVADNLKRKEEIIEQMNNTTKRDGVNDPTVHSSITAGGDVIDSIKDQTDNSPANTVADTAADVKGPTLQHSLHHGDAHEGGDSSDTLSHFASLLKSAPSGVAVDAGEIFDTEEEWLEFEKHFQQVCQEVLYVRVHKPTKFKER